MAETAINFLGNTVKDVAESTADTVVSVVKAPVNFAQKALDGKLQIAGFKPSQLSKDLSALVPVNNFPNSVVGNVNGLLGNAEVLRKTISKHTGLDVDFGLATLGEQFNDIVAPFTPGASKGQLNKKFKNYINSLKARVQAEIDDCIKKHLRALRNKIPALDIALDPELFIAKEIGKIRQQLQTKIDLAKSKLLYKKLKIQQISQWQKDVLAGIKSLCPSTSPTAIKKFQTDEVYKQLRIDKTAAETVATLKQSVDQAQAAVTITKDLVADPKATVNNIAGALETPLN